MTKINFRSCLPYAIALIIFILIAYIYASPVLEGKIINQAVFPLTRELQKKETIIKNRQEKNLSDQFDVQWLADQS